MNKIFKMNNYSKYLYFFISTILLLSSICLFFIQYQDRLLPMIGFVISEAFLFFFIIYFLSTPIFYFTLITDERLYIQISPFSKSSIEIKSITRLHMSFVSPIIFYRQGDTDIINNFYPLNNNLEFIKTLYQLKPDCWVGEKEANAMKEKYNITVENIVTIEQLKEYYKNRSRSKKSPGVNQTTDSKNRD